MSENPETNREAYDRGMIAGEVAGVISARLANHDRHFEAINGHLGDLAGEFRALHLTVQQLRDQAIARDTMTETSLKNMNQGRRASPDDYWFLWVKIYAVISTTALAVAIILALKGLG